MYILPEYIAFSLTTAVIKIDIGFLLMCTFLPTILHKSKTTWLFYICNSTDICCACTAVCMLYHVIYDRLLKFADEKRLNAFPMKLKKIYVSNKKFSVK